jgi:hypothetical protein
MTKEEKETIIRFDATKEKVSIWTAQPSVVNKLAKRGLTPWKTSTREGRPVGWFFATPYWSLTWTIRTKKRTPTGGGFKARGATGG